MKWISVIRRSLVSHWLLFSSGNHRDVLRWSWSAVRGALASVWEEGKSTTWACSSCGWLRRDRLWRTGGSTWVWLLPAPIKPTPSSVSPASKVHLSGLLPRRWETRSWRSTVRPRRASLTPGPSSWSKQEGIKFTCCCGRAKVWFPITVSGLWAAARTLGSSYKYMDSLAPHGRFFSDDAYESRLFFLYAHACVASFYLDVSLLLLCFCLDLPPLLLICSGFLHQHSDFYLFIFSSCRSELFFHPVLLHETRATVKASLLFLVCP